MTRYTVEQQGERWVASDGTHHVESDDPGDALHLLVMGEMEEETGGAFDEGVSKSSAHEIEERLRSAAARVIALAAMEAPREILEPSAQYLMKLVEQLLTERGQ